MAEFVLDASAMLALLQGERGHERVAAIAGTAKVSAVNLAEAGSWLANKGQSLAEVHAAYERIGFDVVPFDREQAFEVARLRPLTRSLGLSLSDRACLALARLLRIPAMTTDRAWTKLHIGVRVIAIR